MSLDCLTGRLVLDRPQEYDLRWTGLCFECEDGTVCCVNAVFGACPEMLFRDMKVFGRWLITTSRSATPPNAVFEASAFKLLDASPLLFKELQQLGVMPLQVTQTQTVVRKVKQFTVGIIGKVVRMSPVFKYRPGRLAFLEVVVVASTSAPDVDQTLNVLFEKDALQLLPYIQVGEMYSISRLKKKSEDVLSSKRWYVLEDCRDGGACTLSSIALRREQKSQLQEKFHPFEH